VPGGPPGWSVVGNDVHVSSAIAVLLGAVCGAGATLGVSILNARFQGKREARSWERENKRDAYYNATRPLLRVRNLRKRMAARGDNQLADPLLTKHLDDVDEAQHGLSTLAVVCGQEQRTALEKAIEDFDKLADEIRDKARLERLEPLSREVDAVWRAVVAAERNDVGASSR